MLSFAGPDRPGGSLLAPLKMRLVRTLRWLGRWRRPLLYSALTIALLAGIFGLWIPARYITIAPGPTPNVATLVTPEAGLPSESETGGLFLLTTVLASGATPVQLWKAMIDPLVDLVPRAAVIPPRMSDETYIRWGEAAMVESRLLAAWQAWAFLGNEVDLVSDGVEVYFIARGSPARGQLGEGDRILDWSMSGRSEAAITPAEMERGIVEAFIYGQGRPGPVLLTLNVMRDDLPVSVRFFVELEDLTAWPFLGLAMGTRDPATDPPVPVIFPDSDIGGPSGGLMMALQIVDFFSPDNLAGGKIIAGSGTIRPGGRVGPVGSVDKKISGAFAAGATVVLVSVEDYPAAVAARVGQGLDSLVLIAVGSLAEAHRALVSLTLENAAGYNSADLARTSLVRPGIRVAI